MSSRYSAPYGHHQRPQYYSQPPREREDRDRMHHQRPPKNNYLHPNSKVPTKALLIGINYTAWPVYGLKGCHADVEAAQNFLEKIGMDPANIRILTDKEDKFAPTRRAILEGFDWIKEGARDGDVLFIHYSGHGVETEPPARNPLNRASSKAIAPVDMFHRSISEIQGRWNYSGLKFVNPITGEDFKRIFGHLENSNVNLTVVYDCCHSTGAMRAIGAPGEPEETSVRGIRVPEAESEIARTVENKADELGSTAQQSRGLDKHYEHRYAPAELVPGYVIGLAAAQGWEPAIDARTPSGPCGAFSHFFYPLLEKHAKHLNAQGVVDSVNKLLKKNRYTQTPSLTTSSSKKFVPWFCDFNRPAHRGLGDGDDESLSATRSVDVEPLNDEHDMIKREERELQNQQATRSVGGGNRSRANSNASRGAPTSRHIGGGADDFNDRLDAGSEAGPPDATATEHVQSVVNIYSQIASSRELQTLRAQDRSLFDALLPHVIQILLQTCKSSLHSYSQFKNGKPDVGIDLAFNQHLPTALNLAQQINSIPEVQEDKQTFEQVFSISMPLVFTTARSLHEAQKSQDYANDPDQQGLFNAVVGKLPPQSFGVLSNVVAPERGVGGDERNFHDILKRSAPMVLNVAGAVVNCHAGRKSLSFVPTDRVFVETLCRVTSKVVGHPTIIKMYTAAINVGMQTYSGSMVGGRMNEPEPSPEYQEAHVRSAIGNMKQILGPKIIEALQAAFTPELRTRGAVTVHNENNIWDIVSKDLPALVAVAQEAYHQKKAQGMATEDEVSFLTKSLQQAVPGLIQHAQDRASGQAPRGSTEGQDRGLLGFLTKVIF